MNLGILFEELAEAFDGPERIEAEARAALLEARPDWEYDGDVRPLPPSILEVMGGADAHPICQLIADFPLPWAPPKSSNDLKYLMDNEPKAHVELLGPGGLVKSDRVRLGLYGIYPNWEYGLRDHPAEEVFVMLAGEAFWKRGAAPFKLHKPGERSWHPSMMQHATKTGPRAFLSAYAWIGDLSFDNYNYMGRTGE